MTKLYLPVILLACNAIVVIAQTNLNKRYDFNGVNWGINKEQVKNKEEARKSVLILVSDKSLSYMNTFEKQPCLITYYFKNNKLIRGVYSFIEQHTESAQNLEKFNRLKATLTNQYGRPIDNESSSVKLDSRKFEPTNSRSDNASALFTTIWKAQNTLIELVLSGDVYNQRLTIKYQNRRLSELKNHHSPK